MSLSSVLFKFIFGSRASLTLNQLSKVVWSGSFKDLPTLPFLAFYVVPGGTHSFPVVYAVGTLLPVVYF